MAISPPIFTLGYAGCTRSQLVAALRENQGLLVDIRTQPFSRHPDWPQHALKFSLRGRYLWVPDWGNRNYRPEDRHRGIEIADLAGGLHRVRAYQPAFPIQAWYLLCGCKVAAHCHRQVVGAWLAAQGFAVSEWRPESGSSQIPLDL